MSDTIKDLIIAVILIAMWFIIAVLLIKFMNLRAQQHFHKRQREKQQSVDLDPPSYEEAVKLRICTV